MAQSRVKVKLEGFKMEVGAFEIEVVGERAEVPQLKAAAMEHVRNLLTPATAVVDGSAQRAFSFDGIAAPTDRPIPPTPSRTARRATSGSKPKRADGTPLEWRPDTQRWGEPRVTWSNFEKGAWILHCYAKEGQGTGLPAGVLAATFNKHFPQAKLVNQAYLERDLKRKGQGDKPKVTEDTLKTPSVWHLSEFGSELVARLVADSKSEGGSVGTA